MQYNPNNPQQQQLDVDNLASDPNFMLSMNLMKLLNVSASALAPDPM